MSGRAMLTMVALAVMPALSGCGDEKINPLDGGTTSGGSTTGDMPDRSFREVFQRNPWGTPAENLLFDGDFELSISPGTGQYGWIALDSALTQQVPIDCETGGTCRSGLRCALVPKGTILLGKGSAAPDIASHQASLFAKPATPPAADADPAKLCGKIANVSVITCDEGSPIATLKPAAAPGDDGYCEFSAAFAGSLQPLCLYVTVKADAILDNGTLLPAATMTSAEAPFSMDLETRERAKKVVAFARKRLRYGEVPAPTVREDLR